MEESIVETIHDPPVTEWGPADMPSWYALGGNLRHRPPGFSRDGGPGRGPDARWNQWQRTIAEILKILTPEQQARWNELTGKPLPYDLRWRLDE